MIYKPISPVANPCCNRVVVRDSWRSPHFGEGNAAARFHQRNSWLGCLAACCARAAVDDTGRRISWSRNTRAIREPSARFPRSRGGHRRTALHVLRSRWWREGDLMALGPDRGAIETRPSDARPPAAYATVRPSLAGQFSIWKLGPVRLPPPQQRTGGISARMILAATSPRWFVRCQRLPHIGSRNSELSGYP
jgi:hypothetical protein